LVHICKCANRVADDLFVWLQHATHNNCNTNFTNNEILKQFN